MIWKSVSGFLAALLLIGGTLQVFGIANLTELRPWVSNTELQEVASAASADLREVASAASADLRLIATELRTVAGSLRQVGQDSYGSSMLQITTILAQVRYQLELCRATGKSCSSLLQQIAQLEKEWRRRIAESGLADAISVQITGREQAAEHPQHVIAFNDRVEELHVGPSTRGRKRGLR